MTGLLVTLSRGQVSSYILTHSLDVEVYLIRNCYTWLCLFVDQILFNKNAFTTLTNLFLLYLLFFTHTKALMFIVCEISFTVLLFMMLCRK